jgi:hypothetical protein
MKFELVDLEELGEKALYDFTQCARQIEPQGAATLQEAVRSLVTKVEFTYA